jgi:hypothetical protein
MVIPVAYSSSVSESLTDIDSRPSGDEELGLGNPEDEESNESDEDKDDEDVNVPVWCDSESSWY